MCCRQVPRHRDDETADEIVGLRFVDTRLAAIEVRRGDATEWKTEAEVVSTRGLSTAIAIDNRRVLQFLGGCSSWCTQRTFDENMAQPVCTQPAWTAERWRSFASGMSALVGSYKGESDPGKWWLCITLPCFGLGLSLIHI